MNSLFGMNLSPEQMMHLSQLMQAPIKLLKGSWNIFLSGKNILEWSSALDKIFEVTETAISQGSTVEFEAIFRDADELHITTVNDAELPQPATNCITINDAKTGNLITTISRDNPRFNEHILTNHIKIATKIVKETNKDYLYSGCKIRIRPKVTFIINYFYSFDLPKEY